MPRRPPLARPLPLALSLAVAALVGCEQVHDALTERQAKPADAAAAPPAAKAAPSDSPAAAEARAARYAERPTVDAPGDLPKAWRGVTAALKGKLTGVVHRRHIGPKPHRHVHLQVRTLGADAQVDAAALGALRSLKLAGAPARFPADADRIEGADWALEIGRLKAPPGVAREHRVELDWRPPAPTYTRRGECKEGVASLTPPEATPRWLIQATRPEQHRWRVATELSAYPAVTRVRLWMVYRSGYTQDDHVGGLVKAAKAQGYERVDGSGPIQRWRGPQGEQLSWQTERGDLALPCAPVGPSLEITWQAAPAEAKAKASPRKVRGR